jgi:CBS domain-containing protein
MPVTGGALGSVTGGTLVKRVNVNDAFANAAEDLAALGIGEGDEAVVLAVRGGEIVAAVSAGTAEEAVIGGARVLRGTLRLENERVLTFQIRSGTSGASFEDRPAEVSARRARAEPDSGARAGLGRTASDIMSREVVTASPDMLVEDIAKLLAFHNISGMPVEGWDGKLVGIVSEADVIGKIGDTIGDVMTSEVISVTESTTIEEIAALMTERRIKRVPVMADGELLGIISRADVVRALAAGRS